MKLFSLLTTVLFLFTLSSCKKDADQEVIPAQFSVSYKVTHDGKYFIEIPKTYEFANTILAVKDMETPSVFINQTTDYYQQLTTNFFPFRFNDIFFQYQFDYKDISSYLGVSLNSFKYEYYQNELESKDVYNTLWNPDLFTPQLMLLNNFYVQSDFETFFNGNADYYAQQILLYDSAVPVQHMWDWLENQFGTKINSYTILISPLTGKQETSRHYSTPDYSETIMFLRGIHRESLPLDDLTQGTLMKSLFTSMDYNYILPISEQYATTIDQSMSRRVIWRDDLEINKSYDTPYKVFNEYMSRAVFCLYLKENYNETFYHVVDAEVVRMMVQERGFVRFAEFKDELIELYDNQDIESLYPKLLQWADAVNDN